MQEAFRMLWGCTDGKQEKDRTGSLSDYIDNGFVTLKTAPEHAYPTSREYPGRGRTGPQGDQPLRLENPQLGGRGRAGGRTICRRGGAPSIAQRGRRRRPVLVGRTAARALSRCGGNLLVQPDRDGALAVHRLQ